ncbi:hypothetical protein D3C85_1549070 [compost metagenome]
MLKAAILAVFSLGSLPSFDVSTVDPTFNLFECSLGAAFRICVVEQVRRVIKRAFFRVVADVFLIWVKKCLLGKNK